MISTPTLMTRPKNRFSRLLGLTAALLLTSAAASMAVTPADTLIQKKLTELFGANVTLTSATFLQIKDAALKALEDVADSDKVLPSAIVTAASNRVPQFTPELSAKSLEAVYRTGVNKLAALNKTTKTADSLKAKEIAAIVKTTFTKGLGTYVKNGVSTLPNGNPYKGTTNKADVAAALTFSSVQVIRGITNDPTAPVTLVRPLKTYVAAAVKLALKAGGAGQGNGAAGLVAGAINELAGVNNDNITNNVGDNATTGKNNALVGVVIQTAVKNAPKNVLDIAQAAGYAFASTYLQTHSGPTAPTSGMEFVQKNTAAIIALIASADGIGAANAKKLGNQIAENINAGIAKAYLGLAGAGSGGVVFVNGEAAANALSNN